MTETQNEIHVARNHKDRLFRMIFREKKELLSLYNAVNGTSYTNAEELEIVTLENAIYMNMKNDLAFIMDSYLNLYEHQSTYSPNMPLRDLFYIAKELPLTELPDERMQMTLGMYGDGDFFTMMGVVEEFFDAVGMTRKKEYDPKAGKPFLHPGRQANIVYDGVVLGYLGEVHPLVLENYNIGTRAYVAVLDMPAIVPFTTFDRKYEGIAKFPAVGRDLSMVVPHDVLVGQIESVLAQRGGKILEHYELFDIYEGEQVKKGYKSVAYSLSFRAKDRTLEEADINAALKKILNGLEQLGIELRQ